ncbi:MAG TPA: hypothetical protein VF627_03960 [Abditibacterium sp.]|jgi:hypothetical protein
MFHPKPFLMTVLLAAVAGTGGPTQAQTGASQPLEVDLSPLFERWSLSLKAQRMRDTCAVFTVTGALEFALSKNLGEGVRFSEEYLNWAANDANGDRADGATFPQLQRGFSKWGIAAENDMPYRANFSASLAPTEAALGGAREVWSLKPKWNWLVRDRSGGLSLEHLAAIKRVLKRGYPVAAGGEHCMLIVACYENWEGGGTFLARDYARSSYETLTFAEVQRRFHSLLWVEFPTQAEDKNEKPER